MQIAPVPVGIGIVGNLGGGKALPAETGWGGSCGLLVERVGTEMCTLGWARSDGSS